MNYDNQNIFAKILRGEIPCDKIYENDHVLAFNDITPQAPTHILLIPKGPYTTINDFGKNATAEELKAFYAAIDTIVTDKNLEKDGFRCIANSGRNAGQEVPHFHMHILGGKPLGPMLQAQK